MPLSGRHGDSRPIAVRGRCSSGTLVLAVMVESIFVSTRILRKSKSGTSDRIFPFDQGFPRPQHGPVHVYAHRGTIERVLQVLGDNVGVPILASKRLIGEVKVYRNHGFAIGDLCEVGSDAGQSAVKERAYIRLYSKGDGCGNEPLGETSVTC